MLHSKNTVIVCANARLSRAIQQHLRQKTLHTGMTTWETPQVKTFDLWIDELIQTGWLSGLMNASATLPLALNNDQESILWEQIISESLRKQAKIAELFDIPGLARSAAEANRLIIEWNLTFHSDHYPEETRHFLNWQKQFQFRCQKLGVLEGVRYRAWQINQLTSISTLLPKNLLLAGFDNIHPHMASFIKTIESLGTTVEPYPNLLKESGKLQKIELIDFLQEYRAVCAWAKELIEQRPETRIGIIVPDMEKHRFPLTRLLDETLHPDACLPKNVEQPRYYDISLGTSLADKPLVATALALLKLSWERASIEQPVLSMLLNSPYWSRWNLEADARAQFDILMRSQMSLKVTGQRWLQFCASKTKGSHPLPIINFQQHLNVLITYSQQCPQKALPSEWLPHFKKILEYINWPGDRSLSSHEYQSLVAFDKVLQRLKQLDQLLGKVTASSAIQQLQRWCTQHLFQPEYSGQPKIQIMGMLEAVETPLDALWVLGMNDHVWPPAARPNPLLPADMQRHAGTPNASNEVQSAFAHQIMQRLIRSASTVHFSYSQKEGDRLLNPSPFLADIPEHSFEGPFALSLAEQAATQPTDWEWLDDHTAPKIENATHIKGGSALLKAQAICPAWAFYQYRLGLRRLETPHSSLDAIQRGNLVHRVLAKAMQHQSSERLANLEEDAIRLYVQDIAQETIREFRKQTYLDYPNSHFLLEIDRLTRLVTEWILNVEKSRITAFEVKACEQMHMIEIAGMTLKLVIDRVDTLLDGRLIVIDYKTGGQIDFKNWRQNLITEPQLPLYASYLHRESTIASVCFGKVHTSGMQYSGVAVEAELIPGAMVWDDNRGKKLFDPTVFPQWESLFQHWQNRLNLTAHGFKNGEASIVFEDETQLRYCEVLPLLRLPERQLQFERMQNL